MDRTARRSWRTISVCVFALVTLSACQKEVTEHATTTILPTVTSKVLILTPSYEHEQTFTGTIRAGNTTGVGFELSGKLNELQADSGIKVKQGQILAILDTRLL